MTTWSVALRGTATKSSSRLPPLRRSKPYSGERGDDDARPSRACPHSFAELTYGQEQTQTHTTPREPPRDAVCAKGRPPTGTKEATTNAHTRRAALVGATARARTEVKGAFAPH